MSFFDDLFNKFFNDDAFFSNNSNSYFKYTVSELRNLQFDEDPFKNVDQSKIEMSEYEKDGFKIIEKKHTKSDGSIVTVTEKTPLEKQKTVKQLETELQMALKNEEYEKCVSLRDEIKKLKTEQKE